MYGELAQKNRFSITCAHRRQRKIKHLMTRDTLFKFQEFVVETAQGKATMRFGIDNILVVYFFVNNITGKRHSYRPGTFSVVEQRFYDRSRHSIIIWQKPDLFKKSSDSDLLQTKTQMFIALFPMSGIARFVSFAVLLLSWLSLVLTFTMIDVVGKVQPSTTLHSQHERCYCRSSTPTANFAQSYHDSCVTQQTTASVPHRPTYCTMVPTAPRPKHQIQSPTSYPHRYAVRPIRSALAVASHPRRSRWVAVVKPTITDFERYHVAPGSHFYFRFRFVKWNSCPCLTFDSNWTTSSASHANKLRRWNASSFLLYT